MKRLTSVFLCVCLLLSFAGCSSATYQEAVSALQQSALTEEGTYCVSAELLTALESAPYTAPRNVIYMIGDGMGYAAVEAAEVRYRDRLYGGKLAMHHLPYSGSSITYSADNAVTDSAAGGTALSAGYKTTNNTVAMNTDDTVPYETVLELASRKGKSTGVVVTKSVTDATPATFTAHVGKRTEQTRIAAQQVLSMQRGTLDLLLGGGLNYFKAGGVVATYATDFAAAVQAPMPLLGLFSGDAMDTADASLPTLAEMTELALERLSEDEDGFFLMVEGSQIDTFAHSNLLEESTREVYAFDCAVAVAMRYVALHPDTLLIVTADHETGGLTLPQPLTADNYDEIYYTSGSHTGVPVPVYAAGSGAEALATLQQNTDIARFVAAVLGEDDFGQADVVHTVCTDGEAVFTADDNIAEYTAGDMPQDVVPYTLHMRVTNVGTVETQAPTVLMDVGDFDVLAESVYVTIQPNETVDLVYVVPVQQRQDVAQGGDVTMMLFPDDEVRLQIESMQYRCRPEGR